MDFYDKNGDKISIGDHLIPDEGRELVILSEVYYTGIGEECLLGQQILDPDAYSPLSQDHLSKQWSIKKEE